MVCTYIINRLLVPATCEYIYDVLYCVFTAPPTVTVSTVQPTTDYPAGIDISLQCSWDTSVYYVAWYKNGVLIYSKDLAASSVLMGPPQGISVDSNFTMMMSTLTIESPALNDSGNYTCAVTRGAKGVEFDMIAGNMQDTAEVFVYGEWYMYMYMCMVSGICT